MKDKKQERPVQDITVVLYCVNCRHHVVTICRPPSANYINETVLRFEAKHICTL